MNIIKFYDILPTFIQIILLMQTIKVHVLFAKDSNIYSTNLLYFGDVTLWHYLANWCEPNGLAPSNSRLVIVGDLRNNSIINHLSAMKNNCQFHLIPLQNFSSNNLLQSLRNNVELQFNQLLILFDFTTQPMLSQSQFNWYMIELDHAYIPCQDCFPFILLFNHRTEQLRRWSIEIYPKFSKNFRTVLVSSAIQDQNPPTVVHIKPILNGCVQYQGVLVPKQRSEFDQLRVPFQKCNLNSTTLTAMIYNVLPYCHVAKQNNGTLKLKYSIESEILQILMKQFNFKTNFESEKIFGKIINGHGTGTVGRVYNQSANFGMCAISKDQHRSRYLDYSVVTYGELTFMSAMPKQKTRHWVIAYPYSGLVWLFILCSFVILTVVITVLINFENNATTLTKIVLVQLVDSIATKLLLVILNQSSKFQATKLYRVRLIYGSWLLVSIILLYAYVGQFYSIMTFPEFETPLDTTEQLMEVARDDRGFIRLFANSSQMYRFVHSSPSDRVYYPIGQHINRTKQKHFKNLRDINEAFDSPTTKNIFINERRLLLFYRRFYSRQPLYIAHENLNKGLCGFIFPKKSPLYFPFRELMERIHFLGYQEGWIKRMSYGLQVKNAECQLSGNPPFKRQIGTLNLANLESVFVVFLLGILMSCVVLVGEIVTFRLLT